MRFNVNDSERIRIDSSGNVGIGTTSPSAKINIESNAADQFKITRTGVASWGLNTYSSGDFVIDNGAERMRIDSSGNVGIGTASPARDFHLHRDTLPDIHITNSDSGSSLTDGATLTLGGLDFLINNREAGNLVLCTFAFVRRRMDTTQGFLLPYKQ